MLQELNAFFNDTATTEIYTIRGTQVMLDFDLAMIYGYTTKAFNQQIKNNRERFDDDFMFQLTDSEVNFLRSKFLTTNFSPKSRSLPYAFTEQGIYMLMTVLKGELAVTQGKMLIRMFKEMKQHQIKADERIDELFSLMDKYNIDEKQGFLLTLNHTTTMHDRFMIIDGMELYHIGASLKDLGKKCFAFEVLDAAIISAILQIL